MITTIAAASKAVVFVFAMWVAGEAPEQPKYYETESESDCAYLVEYAKISALQYSRNLGNVDINLIAQCVSQEDLEERAI